VRFRVVSGGPGLILAWFMSVLAKGPIDFELFPGCFGHDPKFANCEIAQPSSEASNNETGLHLLGVGENGRSPFNMHEHIHIHVYT
jgi:hypothetical protein